MEGKNVLFLFKTRDDGCKGRWSREELLKSYAENKLGCFVIMQGVGNMNEIPTKTFENLVVGWCSDSKRKWPRGCNSRNGIAWKLKTEGVW